MAPSVGMEVSAIIDARCRRDRTRCHEYDDPNGGLILTASTWAVVHRDLVIAPAARHRLPAVSTIASFVDAGGLRPIGSSMPNSSTARPDMSIILKGAKARPICRCKRRPSTISSRSTLELQNRSALRCRDIAGPADEVIE